MVAVLRLQVRVRARARVRVRGLTLALALTLTLNQVLFGEWCLARHSVPYTRLPGYFIAFDIYSKRSGKRRSVEPQS